MLCMQPKFVASSAAFIQNAHLSHANTATASKRTAWYGAFADQATWSPIG
jgi:hypothetical protein